MKTPFSPPHEKKQHYDDASVFKRKSLNAIERRKKMEKVLYYCMILTAIILFITVIVLYTM